jgi:hypothetical protein
MGSVGISPQWSDEGLSLLDYAKHKWLRRSPPHNQIQTAQLRGRLYFVLMWVVFDGKISCILFLLNITGSVGAHPH